MSGCVSGLGVVEKQKTKLKMLDCFCGIGGVSDGFALEGFDVTGIDIVDALKMLGYKHKFIQADMLMLKGEDFRGYDVVWGSPPCRDFSILGKCYGKKWKRPPQPEVGLQLVNTFLKFIEDAKPQFWIMENVSELTKYINLKPTCITTLFGGKKHAFFGHYPQFLMSKVKTHRLMTVRDGKFPNPHPEADKNKKLKPWINARIPLACSRAFAKACREALLPELEGGV